MKITSYKLLMVRDGGVSLPQDTMRSPDIAVKLAREYLAGADREHFIVIALSSPLKIIGIHTVAIGTLDEALLTGREVFKFALLSNACSIIVAHNRPSGDCAPSKDDIEMTKRLVEAGKLLGVKVEDHLIIGEGDDITSLKARGVGGL